MEEQKERYQVCTDEKGQKHKKKAAERVF